MSDCKYCELRNIEKGEPHRYECPGLIIEQLEDQLDKDVQLSVSRYKEIERLTAEMQILMDAHQKLAGEKDTLTAEYSDMQDAWLEFRDEIECGQLPTEMKCAVMKSLDSFESIAILEIRKAQDSVSGRPETGDENLRLNPWCDECRAFHDPGEHTADSKQELHYKISCWCNPRKRDGGGLQHFNRNGSPVEKGQ